jgi:hypothetical protein
MAVSPVLIASRNYQAQLARYESAATGRLIDNYLRSWARLEGMLNKLLLEIGTNTPTRGQLARMERYKALMNQITTELTGLQALTGNEIAGVGDLIALGEQYARDVIALQIAGSTQIAAGFNRLPVETIQTMLGFLQPEGALYARLAYLTGVNVKIVADALAEAVTLGWNPRKTARYIRDAFGRGLADALRFTRTAQLWASREATRASMVVNQDVLQGWVWNTNFDKRTCMSCVVMHGTIHPLSESLNDHHNGRCVAIPLVKGFTPVIQETGVQWFERQNEATQRAMMGREYYDAWKGGAFQLPELSTVYHNDVYGDMRGEARLWQLLGAEPPVRVSVGVQ